MWACFYNYVDSLNPKTLRNYEEVTVLVLTFKKVFFFSVLGFQKYDCISFSVKFGLKKFF